MNSVHDMGGQQGFGPVLPEANEPLFHAAWEKRALGLTVAMGASGQWNIDLSRAARESLPPTVYLASSYYEIWLRGLQKLMLQRGMVQTDELPGGQTPTAALTTTKGLPVVRVLHGSDVDATLAKGSPASRPATTAARFKVGDVVQAKNMHPAGHTRLPRYVRGHTGTVQRVHGAHILPDRHATKPLPPFDDHAEWLYTVVFHGRALWGPETDVGLQVSVDAWESYLEPAA